MALINCPECGRENVSNSAEHCPSCGYGIRSHFEKIKEREQKRKDEEERQLALKKAEEKRIKEEAEIKKRKEEQRQKSKIFWENNKIKIVAAVIAVIVLVIGFVVVNNIYIRPSSICKKAEEYIAEGKYEDALNELMQIGNFGDSDKLYREALIGITENNYNNALKDMREGKLDSAYEILSSLNMEFVTDKEDVANSIELVKQYMDSEWIGSWENDGFSFVRYTNVAIKEGKAYIQLTQSNSDSIRHEAEYPLGNSFLLKILAQWMDMLN